MYSRIAIQVEAQPPWKWQSTARSIAEYRVAVVAGLSGFSARALAHLLFPFTGNVERAARAREPGTGIHFSPGHTVPASKGDHSTRSREGSMCWWVTGTRANDLHPCRNRRHLRRERHERALQAKRSIRTRSGWRS